MRDYLTHLARDRQVSASTQNQALAALLFLYRHVLEMPVAIPGDHLQAKRPVRLPVVLTPDEVRRVLEAMHGVPALVARLLYGSGLRLLEGCSVRVKDLDLERREVLVRSGKGQKDRRTVLPESLVAPLTAHLEAVQARARARRARRAGPRGTARCAAPQTRSRGGAQLGLAVGVSRQPHV